VVRNNSTVASVSGSNLSYIDKTVSGATTYTYQLIAYDAAGNSSALSTGVSVTTPSALSAPTAPSGLTAAAASSSQINLSWTASSGSPTSYDIYRNNTKVATISATTTSFGDTGLTANTAYSYYLKATNSVGSSPASNTATATTGSVTTTGQGNLQGTVTNSSGTPLSGVRVSLTFNGSTHSYLTNSSGFYQAVNIPTGSYTVTFSVKKYSSQSVQVNIVNNTVTTQNITLSSGGGKGGHR
jgi:hypothetical protein